MCPHLIASMASFSYWFVHLPCPNVVGNLFVLVAIGWGYWSCIVGMATMTSWNCC
jgi:hypothetical protein